VVALTELADAYARLGQHEKSLELLQECAVVDPERRPVYLLAAAWTRRRMGDLDGAFRDARQARELAPDRAEPWWLLATLHRERREMDEAERALRRAAELDPLQARFRQNLASLYLETDRPRAAVAEARAAVALAPEYPEGRYTLGMALAHDHQQEEARRVLRDLVADYPQSAIAQRARGLLAELEAGAAPR
jgi:tetratricopeptide (TPR) repeat protein